MSITGGCLCGQFRYEITQAPKLVRLCWCRVCQYFAAGNAVVSAMFDKEAVRMTGRRTEYISKADSGSIMHRTFCPDCGTPLFSEAEPRPNVIFVRVGTFDDPEIGRPTAAIWTSSAPTWACFDPHMPRIERGPPPPPNAS
jgi:hypothetical protein